MLIVDLYTMRLMQQFTQLILFLDSVFALAWNALHTYVFLCQEPTYSTISSIDAARSFSPLR